MKILTAITAGCIGLAAYCAPTPLVSAASAQERVVRERVITQNRTVVRTNGYGRDRFRNKRVCTVRYRNGNRIRRCRTVRVRY